MLDMNLLINCKVVTYIYIDKMDFDMDMPYRWGSG